MPPHAPAAARYMACTESSSATSTWTARPPHAPATVCAASPSRSATQTLAPSFVNTSAASAPMPPPAPVITQTLPSSRPAMSGLRRVEHVLDLAVALERVHAELTAEAALLHAAERRRRAYRRVRVDREDARLDRPGGAQGAPAVPRPDRAGEPVAGAVRDPHSLGLVRERDERGDRPEDLLARNPVVRPGLDERGRIPEPAALRHVTAEGRSRALNERADGPTIPG